MTEQLHEITFRWPSSDAQDVIVTGSFDGWSSSTHLTKTSSGFEGTARVPYGAKVAYKYIVDGRWTTADGQPTEFDPVGNVNNVYSAPAAPPSPVPAVKGENGSVVSTVKETVAGLTQTAAAMVEEITPSVSSPTPTSEAPTSDSSPEPAAPEPATEPAPAAATPPVEPTPTSEPDMPSTVLPSSEVAAPHLAPEVPIHVLPLQPIPPESATVEGAAVDTNGVPASENGPSTHEVAGEPVVGDDEREKAIGGEGVVPDETAKPTTNGTEAKAESTPITNGTTEAKAVVNGTTNGTPAPALPSPPQTPPAKEKEKRMRFPSLSARHSRRSSSSANTSVSELGETAHSPGSKEKLDTHASRAAAGETVRRKRTSIFGKIKGIFDSPHANGHGKTASNGA